MKYAKHLLTAALAAALLCACGNVATPTQTARTDPAEPNADTMITEADPYPETTVNHVWGTAASWDELRPPQNDLDYSTLTLPDYRTQNPVRYMDIDPRGEKCNGWQDFGTAGELRTTPQPMNSTYLYQTYSYFIRNDLTHLYPNDTLPTDPEYLSKWLADISAVGRRALWYSVGEMPQRVDYTDYTELTAESGAVIGRATYQIDGRTWMLYLLCEENTASVLGIRPNDSGDYVINFTDTIAKSYRVKTS